jgi:hypothetical protein
MSIIETVATSDLRTTKKKKKRLNLLVKKEINIKRILYFALFRNNNNQFSG